MIQPEMLLLRVLFNAPALLHRWNLGAILGQRLLVLTYRARPRGPSMQTVLEVVRFDRTTLESVVVSAHGTRASWYLGIRAAPALRIQTGRLDYAPRQRFLTPHEAREVAQVFCNEHPVEAGLAPHILSWIGAMERCPGITAAEMLATLPMVGFRPPAGRWG